MTTPSADAKRISVGIGQLAITRNTGELLVAYGLGSCIGVSCYDPQTKVAGLATESPGAAAAMPTREAVRARFAG